MGHTPRLKQLGARLGEPADWGQGEREWVRARGQFAVVCASTVLSMDARGKERTVCASGESGATGHAQCAQTLYRDRL